LNHGVRLAQSLGLDVSDVVFRSEHRVAARDLAGGTWRLALQQVRAQARGLAEATALSRRSPVARPTCGGRGSMRLALQQVRAQARTHPSGKRAKRSGVDD